MLKNNYSEKEMALRDFATELTGIACILMIADGQNDKDKAIGDVMEMYGKILLILQQMEKVPEGQPMITDLREIAWPDFTTNFTR